MDKVIIDGIDVSECVCFATAQGVATVNGILVKDIDNACTVKQKPCEDIKNCMFKKQYKQLQRLKSENENLKIYIESNKQQIEEVETLVMENAELKSDIESRTMCITCERELQNCNLQAENERLKEENNSFMNGEYCANGCKKMNNTFQDVHKCLIQKNEQYRQALQEIRELMHENDNIAGCEYCYGDIRYSILAKINEVIGAE